MGLHSLGRGPHGGPVDRCTQPGSVDRSPPPAVHIRSLQDGYLRIGLYRISGLLISGIRPDIRFYLPDIRFHLLDIRFHLQDIRFHLPDIRFYLPDIHLAGYQPEQ